MQNVDKGQVIQSKAIPVAGVSHPFGMPNNEEEESFNRNDTEIATPSVIKCVPVVKKSHVTCVQRKTENIANEADEETGAFQHPLEVIIPQKTVRQSSPRCSTEVEMEKIEEFIKYISTEDAIDMSHADITETSEVHESDYIIKNRHSIDDSWIDEQPSPKEDCNGEQYSKKEDWVEGHSMKGERFVRQNSMQGEGVEGQHSMTDWSDRQGTTAENRIDRCVTEDRVEREHSIPSKINDISLNKTENLAQNNTKDTDKQHSISIDEDWIDERPSSKEDEQYPKKEDWVEAHSTKGERFVRQNSMKGGGVEGQHSMTDWRERQHSMAENRILRHVIEDRVEREHSTPSKVNEISLNETENVAQNNTEDTDTQHPISPSRENLLSTLDTINGLGESNMDEEYKEDERQLNVKGKLNSAPSQANISKELDGPHYL